MTPRRFDEILGVLYLHGMRLPVQSRYVATLRLGKGYTIELFKNPDSQEMKDCADDIGETRGMILQNEDLWIWTPNLEGTWKGNIVEHEYVLSHMPSWHSQLYLPVVFRVRAKIVFFSPDSFRQPKEKVGKEEIRNSIKNNPNVKSLGFKV